MRVLFLIILLSSLIFPDKGNSQANRHVVLISIDGSRPQYYMDSSWPAPTLQSLKSIGVYAPSGIKSIFPSTTFPAHTSMITGVLPNDHGIYDNSRFEGRRGEWYWYYSTIKCKTIWDFLRDAKLTSGSVYWPVTVGAPINFNFPERGLEEGEIRKDYNPFPYARPQELTTQIWNVTGLRFSQEDFSPKGLKLYKSLTTISNFIIGQFKPNFVAIHLTPIDYVQHVSGGTESLMIRETVRVTDSLISTILQSAKKAGIWDSTTFIITGDHGHVNTTAVFSPNVYLKRKGLIDKFGWKAKFDDLGGSCFLHLKDETDTLLLSYVTGILKESPEYKNGYFQILEKRILDSMGVTPNVGLALAMKEGVIINSSIDGNPFEMYNGPAISTHGYLPCYQSMNTMFLAFGNRIQKGKIVNSMSITDIPKLIAYILDLNTMLFENELVDDVFEKVRGINLTDYE